MNWAELSFELGRVSWSEILLGRVVLSELSLGRVVLHPRGIRVKSATGQVGLSQHESQYTRYFAYSDALKNSFFPRTIPMWNSLPSSVVSSKTIEEFKAQI